MCLFDTDAEMYRQRKEKEKMETVKIYKNGGDGRWYIQFDGNKQSRPFVTFEDASASAWEGYQWGPLLSVECPHLPEVKGIAKVFEHDEKWYYTLNQRIIGVFWSESLAYYHALKVSANTKICKDYNPIIEHDNKNTNPDSSVVFEGGWYFVDGEDKQGPYDTELEAKVEEQAAKDMEGAIETIAHGDDDARPIRFIIDEDLHKKYGPLVNEINRLTAEVLGVSAAISQKIQAELRKEIYEEYEQDGEQDEDNDPTVIAKDTERDDGPSAEDRAAYHEYRGQELERFIREIINIHYTREQADLLRDQFNLLKQNIAPDKWEKNVRYKHDHGITMSVGECSSVKDVVDKFVQDNEKK